MGLLDIGSIGNIGRVVAAVIGIGISAIILFTFAPGIAGDVNVIWAESQNACVYNGERFTQVVTYNGTDLADAAWNAPNSSNAVEKGSADNNGKCTFGTSASTPVEVNYYTPKGTEIQIAASAQTASSPIVLADSEWKAPSKSMTALAGGGLVMLLLGVMAVLIPAGAIGFLTWTGAELVRNYIGGSILAIAIGATIAVTVVGAILPQIFTPLDNLFNVMDGRRYQVYNQGIGKLGGILSDFFAIALLGGIVALGAMLWRGTPGSEGN